MKRRLFLGLILLILHPGSVFAQRIAEIQIAPPFMRIVQDAQAQFVATVYDGDGAPVNVRIRWTSSNINIATVDSAGVVKAIMPGNVVVSAIVESENRRIIARAAVNVLRPREPRPTMVTIPGMPPNLPSVPGQPPGGRPNYVIVQTDSAVRASINCNEPFLNAANPMRACYDSRAMLRDSSLLAERPVADKCAQAGGLERGMLFVLVNESGTVEQATSFATQECPEFLEATIAWSRRLTFSPALKDGHPVRSWVRVGLRGR